jgi:hypothetical protein
MISYLEQQMVGRVIGQGITWQCWSQVSIAWHAQHSSSMDTAVHVLHRQWFKHIVPAASAPKMYWQGCSSQFAFTEVSK